jgi:hypothetical protein
MRDHLEAENFEMGGLFVFCQHFCEDFAEVI